MVVGLALAGCGGSSDNGQNPPGGGNGDDNNYDCADGTKTKDRAACLKKIQDAQNEAAEEEEAAKKASATNELLHAAMNLPESAVPVALTTTLNIGTIPANFNSKVTTEINTINLKAGDDVDALKGWKGKDYKLSDGEKTAKRTTEARIYHNQGAAETGKPLQNSDFNGAATFNVTDGVVTITPTSSASKLIKVTAFSSGTTTLSDDQKKNQPGSINDIAGTFSCTGTCSVQAAAGGTTLTGTWTFSTSATASRPDTDYLYFGWWVHKNDKDEPLAASAFAVRHGSDNTKIALSTGLNALGGSATYEGAAAGKYADLNQRVGTATGGHFIADAMLEATFEAAGGTTKGGVKGTIDNFRLNDGSDDPDWSVALGNKDDFTNTDSTTTTWSIGESEGTADGNWTVSFYDEQPGNAPGGDGSNIPTTATGTFHSEFGSDLKMVGAFGANKK